MSWRFAAASTIGTSHLRLGMPCQDRHAVQVYEGSNGPVLVGIVSDGAGSAEYAEVGAMLCCAVPIALLRNYVRDGNGVADLSRDWFVNCVDRLQQVIGMMAAAQSCPIDAYSATLAIAVADDDHVCAVQIGDGAIVANSGGWRWLTWPHHGEFANSTTFVTSDSAIDVMQVIHQPTPVGEICLFSDGLENLLLQKSDSTVYAPFFERMLPAVRRSSANGLDATLSSALEDYLSSAPVCARTDDDKSLILATRSAPQ